MSMNPYLAELYNTNGYQEKIAQIEANVEAFIKAAQAEGLDLSGLSDDEIIDHAQDWAENNQPEDDGYDKLAEADFMGRAMAHAYADELNKIAGAADKIKGAWEATKNTAKRYGELLSGGKFTKGRGQMHIDSSGALGAKRGGDLARKHIAESGDALSKAEKMKLIRTNREAGTTAGRAAGTKDVSKEKLKALGAQVGTAAGVGALGGGAYLATRKKESQVQEVNRAAIDYANDLLALSADGQNITFAKVAAAQETEMDHLIAEIAWDLLRSEGYVG